MLNRVPVLTELAGAELVVVWAKLPNVIPHTAVSVNNNFFMIISFNVDLNNKLIFKYRGDIC
jgi:hypothetical protein